MAFDGNNFKALNPCRKQPATTGSSMKSAYFHLLLMLIGLCFNALAGSAENLALYNQINQHWHNRAYQQIFAIIQAREQADSSDVLALSLKQYYYVFADKDITKAHQAAAALNSVLGASSNQKLKDIGQVMMKRVTDIPVTETSAYTTQQRDALHAALEDFPFIDECFVLWGLASGQVPP